jgi:hypothetical protein
MAHNATPSAVMRKCTWTAREPQPHRITVLEWAIIPPELVTGTTVFNNKVTDMHTCG